MDRSSTTDKEADRRSCLDKAVVERMARLVLDLGEALDRHHSLHLQMLSSAPDLPPMIQALSIIIRNLHPDLMEEMRKQQTKGTPGTTEIGGTRYIHELFNGLNNLIEGDYVQNGHGWAEPPEGEY